MSEDAFKSRVIDYAMLRGWLVAHYRPARTDKGWRTALEGHRGAPDLILARDGRVLLVELKSDKGRVATEQAVWGSALGDYYRLWRPSQWDQVMEDLR
jgi:hypothetical protein